MTLLLRVLKAYPTLLRVGFASALAYRAELLIWMLTTTMPLVSLALWSAVASQAPVGRFGARDFTAYFLATLIVRQLTGCWLIWEINMDIKSGSLSQYLLRPMHPLIVYASNHLAAIPLRALLCVPIAAVALVVAAGNQTPSLGMIGIWVLSLIGAWLINFFMMAWIGTLAFVMESSTSIFEIYLAGFMVFAGYLVPIELFPLWLQKLCHVLPFRYSLGFPVELITGLLPQDRILEELLIQWGFALGVIALALVSFRAGIRRFSAFGG